MSIVLFVWDRSNKWRPVIYMVIEPRSCSQWAYEGEVEQWEVEVEVEGELAEMTGSLDQLVELEEKEEEEEDSGYSVHGSESESDCSELLAQVLVARVVFIEGARAFQHMECILEMQVFAAIAVRSRAAVLLESWWKEWRCVVGGGRCVGRVKVCGTVLEMGQ